MKFNGQFGEHGSYEIDISLGGNSFAAAAYEFEGVKGSFKLEGEAKVILPKFAELAKKLIPGTFDDKIIDIALAALAKL